MIRANEDTEEEVQGLKTQLEQLKKAPHAPMVSANNTHNDDTKKLQNELRDKDEKVVLVLAWCAWIHTHSYLRSPSWSGRLISWSGSPLTHPSSKNTSKFHLLLFLSNLPVPSSFVVYLDFVVVVKITGLINTSLGTKWTITKTSSGHSKKRERGNWTPLVILKRNYAIAFVISRSLSRKAATTPIGGRLHWCSCSASVLIF